MFAQVSEGAVIAYLAGARADAFQKAATGANRPPGIGCASPRHQEDVIALVSRVAAEADVSVLDDYLSRASQSSQLRDTNLLRRAVQVLLTNKVKKCTVCSKPNAFSLAFCNQCGADLEFTEVSRTVNVFTGFMFGFSQAGPIPLKISMRYATDKLLVMDDLLALAPLHFNVIPTDQYIPDWRYLLLKPAVGLALITSMFDACVEAGTQLLANSDWSERYIRKGENHAPFDLRSHVGAGFNYPPSQYQLHIQFIAPCLVPFQWAQYLKGVHFTFKRFFPIAFVKEVLQRLVDEGLGDGVLSTDGLSETSEVGAAYRGLLKVDKSLPGGPFSLQSEGALPSIDDILMFTDNVMKLSYMDAHARHISEFSRNQSLYSNWQGRDFSGYVVTSTAGSVAHSDIFVPLTTPTQGTNSVPPPSADKDILQSYGRPYTETGRPSGCYYAFPKELDTVNLW